MPAPAPPINPIHGALEDAPVLPKELPGHDLDVARAQQLAQAAIYRPLLLNKAGMGQE